MLVRKLVRCLGCGGDYILRFGIGLGFEQRLAWPCPLCGAETRAHFSVKQKEVDADFKTDDIQIYVEQPTEELPGVNLYSELPVHSSSKGKGLDEGGSAWLRLREFIEPSKYPEYVRAKEGMQLLRERAFPMIRRGVGQFKRENWLALRGQIEPFVAQIPDLRQRHPAYGFSRLLDTAFIPILDVTTKVAAMQEVIDLLIASERDHKSDFHQYLNDAFASQGLGSAQGRCLDVLTRLFDVYDALILPLATERFTVAWRSRLAEFRVYRDDFEVLKGIYQDIFESMNQILVWLGMLANLAKRGGLRSWSNGSNASFSAAQRWRAVDNEFIIRELPVCEALLNKASRSLRNDIGHYSVHHDVVTGELVLADGSRRTLIEFHEDLLAAARLLSVLVGFCEKMTLDHERLVVGSPMDGWK